MKTEENRITCPTCKGDGSVPGRELDGFFPGRGKEADLTYLCPTCDGDCVIPDKPVT